MTPVLEVDGLTVEFPTAAGPVQAVRGIDLRLRRGEVFGLVGESGSGKSATALAVVGLLPRSARVRGAVRVRGTALTTPREYEAARGKTVAMILQDPLSALNPVLPVGYQVAEAVRAHQDVSRRAARDRTVDLLRTVGLAEPERRLRAYPHELSGGMRQRVVIAIAMANDPDVIIADEPTTALDVTVQAQVLDALAAARARTGAALLLITHDLGVVAGQADRVGVMYAGRLVEEGPVNEVFYHPRMPYTRGLLASLPRLDRAGGGRLTAIAGAPPALRGLPPGCPFAPRCPMTADLCVAVEPELVGGGGHRAACHFAGAGP